MSENEERVNVGKKLREAREKKGLTTCNKPPKFKSAT